MSEKKYVSEKQMAYRAFLNRENNEHHHAYQEDMLQYEYVKAGDPRAIPESIRMFTQSATGKLSDHELTNKKYLFICSVTLASRFAIEGGLESETAYTASDLFIRQMDRCRSPEEVNALHTEMFTFFMKEVASVRKESVYSKPVLLCMDYIYDHLHEKISVQDLADQTGKNPKYLSTLFKKETGSTIGDYIVHKRLEAAKNMLKYSDYNSAEISSLLGFSSQSRFIEVFRKQEGMTPGEYRRRNYRTSFKTIESSP